MEPTEPTTEAVEEPKESNFKPATFWITQKKKVGSLKFHPKNPRTITEKGIDDMQASISQFGYAEPVVVNLNNVIIAGHKRVAAFLDWELQDEEIEVRVPNRLLSPIEHEKLMLLDNKMEEHNWDWDKINNEFDMALLEEVGFTEAELVGVGEDKKDVVEDEPPEVSKEPAISKLGEVYTLGRHRLMCGDSTKIEDVEKLMNGQKADSIYTDPPYGMDLDVDYDEMFKGDSSHKETGERFDKVKADNSYFDPSFIFTLLPVKEIFLWGADYFYDSLPRGGSWSSWDKRSETLDAVIGNTTEFLWSKVPHRRMTARVLWSGHHGMGKDDDKVRVHPTQKPVTLHKWFFETYGKNFNNVLDLFGGSGSTLIACEQLNRTCYMMEIDPKYCDVIRKRYAKFVGKEGSWQGVTPAIL